MIPTLRFMGTLSRIVTNEGNQRFAKYGLNNNQFIYLILNLWAAWLLFFSQYWPNEDGSNHELSRRSELNKKGYVIKQTHPENKKVRCLYPTSAGQALYPELHAYEQWCADLVGG